MAPLEHGNTFSVACFFEMRDNGFMAKKRPADNALFRDNGSAPPGAILKKKAATKSVRPLVGPKDADAVAETSTDVVAEAAEKVFGVAEFIEVLNTFFRKQVARVMGEISELKRAASGHVYFTLKDKRDGGVLDAIIWSRSYERCGIALAVGMEVIAAGHPNIYPPTGRLSFVVDTVELVGEGALKKAYDALKAKLAAEGVFAEGRKRPLPELVRRIGVITSLKGAVIHDFENNLGPYGFVVSVCDARVEGQQAVASILAALSAMAKENIEALVIIRGGGSLESLQAFNNEAVVRAIADFRVPVVAGIGHDEDVPLAALAADAMVSTPTAAAHLLGRSWEEAFAKIHRLASVFVRMQEEFKRVRENLGGILALTYDAIAHRIASLNDRLSYAERAVVLNDPTRQLKLGYAIARHKGKIVRSVRDVGMGDALATQLRDGVVQSRVDAIE
jgi:exodeoxyribonuclease VII large subunit